MFKNLIQRFLSPATPKRNRRKAHRGLRLERLDRRAVLAADIGAITGTTFIDLNGNGTVDAADTRISVNVSLFRDGGNGVFGGDDTLVQTITSNATPGPTLGDYRFDGLAAGRYFVQQAATVAPAGLTNPGPVTVNIATGSVRTQAIDTFDTTAVPTITANTGNPVQTVSAAATEAIGGERDIVLTRTGAVGSVSLEVETTIDVLSVGSALGTGTALLQYDGVDGTTTLNPTGLGGLNLSAGDSRSGLLLRVEQANPTTGGVTVTIYSSATNFSTANIAYPAGANPGPVEIFVPFSSFTTGVGAAGAANFTSVGAIEELITLVADQDVRVSIIEAVKPETVEANLVNIQPLTIGNLVFQDNNNDGLFGNGDVGLANVDVELYKLNAIGDTVNPNTQTPVQTTTTSGTGAYSFANVAPGFYAIVIPAREFDATSNAAGARTLVGYATSTPNPETAGANANVDNDDDGRAVTGQLYVASGVFQLVSGDEPAVGGGNTNNTFDFGFVANAEVEVTKTFVGVTVANDGSRTATFRIDVVNNGPLTATGIKVVDTLPTGVTFNRVSSTTDPNAAPAGVTTTSVNGSDVTINLNNLGSTAGTSFNIIVNVAATVFGDQTNRAVVSANENDPDTTNNTDTAILDLPVTDLSITKRLETQAGAVIPPATARTGDTVVYRLTVDNDINNSNAIDDVATGVSVVDTLPVGVTFVSGRINSDPVGNGITFDANTRRVTANVGTVTRGTPAVILLTVTVNSDAADLITNSATVSNLPDTDNVTGNDTASVDNNITRAVDLAVVKSVSTTVGDNTTAVFGAPITFVITVTNTQTSPGNARGFTVTDVLPAGMTLVANSFNAGTSGVTLQSNGQNLTFTGGALTVGQSVSFKFNALIAQSAAATITNTATVAPINNGAIVDTDINAANNSENEVVTPARNVELVVTKTSNITGTQTGTPGSNITYSVTVRNDGPSDAVNVNVTDTLPAGVTAQSITIGGNQVTDNNPDAGIIGFVIPSVLAGANNAVTVQIVANIAATVTASSITNSVTISGGGVNDLPAGNSATVTTPLAPVVDVAVVKTGPATAIPGGAAITYNLAISNSGPSVATNVNVADDLPAGVTIQSVTLNGTAVTNTGTNGDVAFVIPTLGVGNANAQNAVITVIVDPATTGTLNNTATVTATGDNNAANNTSTTVSTTLTPNADVTVTKTVNNTTATPGSSLTYTITVRNAGPSTAAGVTMVDTLPTGLTFTSGTGPNNQTLNANGQTVNVNVGTLAPNATAVYTIIAAIGANFQGSVVNTTDVATTTNEGANALVNRATATTVVDSSNNSISGRVFRDRNNNGLFEPAQNETGIGGVTLQLRAVGNNTVLQTVTTAADGTYRFSGLAAGQYTVQQTQPSGFNDGLEQAGANATPAQTTNDTITPVTVAAGAGDVPGFNFAEIELLSKRRFLASTT